MRKPLLAVFGAAMLTIAATPRLSSRLSLSNHPDRRATDLYDEILSAETRGALEHRNLRNRLRALLQPGLQAQQPGPVHVTPHAGLQPPQPAAQAAQHLHGEGLRSQPLGATPSLEPRSDSTMEPAISEAVTSRA